MTEVVLYHVSYDCPCHWSRGQVLVGSVTGSEIFVFLQPNSDIAMLLHLSGAPTYLPPPVPPYLPTFRTLQIAIVFNLICCAIINVFKQLVCWPIILADLWWSCFKFTAACRTYLPRILPVVTSETESLTVQICASWFSL